MEATFTLDHKDLQEAVSSFLKKKLNYSLDLKVTGIEMNQDTLTVTVVADVTPFITAGLQPSAY